MWQLKIEVGRAKNKSFGSFPHTTEEKAHVESIVKRSMVIQTHRKTLENTARCIAKIVDDSNAPLFFEIEANSERGGVLLHT